MGDVSKAFFRSINKALVSFPASVLLLIVSQKCYRCLGQMVSSKPPIETNLIGHVDGGTVEVEH